MVNLFAHTLIMQAKKDLVNGGLSKFVVSQIIILGRLLKMMEEQAQNSKNNMSVEDDEISIEEVSSLIKKSVSTIYRYTCQNSIPHSKQGNTLHFYRSEILEWMKMHKKKCINELSDEAHIESFRVLNRD